MTSSIISIDNLKTNIYDSKFNQWINNNPLTALFIDKHTWKLKTVNSNLNFKLIYKNTIPIIKSIFNVGFICITESSILEEVVETIMRFGEKSDLIGHIFCQSINSNNNYFISIILELNIYNGIDTTEILNEVFDEIQAIKESLSFALDLEILDLKDFEDEEEDEAEQETLITPYDTARE